MADEGQTKRYKVFYYAGDELTIKTRVTKGHAWVDDRGLHLGNESEEVVVPVAELISANLFRLHGLGRVIRVEHHKGRLFVSVIRLMIGQQFAFINFLKTGALQKQIAAAIRNYHV